jgi:hypothetical protein
MPLQPSLLFTHPLGRNTQRKMNQVKKACQLKALKLICVRRQQRRKKTKWYIQMTLDPDIAMIFNTKNISN